MIIPDDGDADLLTVLSRLSSSYAELAGAFATLLSLPLTLASKRIALSSAPGNSCEWRNVGKNNRDAYLGCSHSVVAQNVPRASTGSELKSDNIARGLS